MSDHNAGTRAMRACFRHWIAEGGASSWIMLGTLAFAMIAAMYLNPSATHSAHSGATSVDPPPTISADGRLAQPNLQPPTTPSALAVWAPFVFTRAYQAGTLISFTEDRTAIARSLVPSALRSPWRWDFGDGTTATGWTVRHAYTRPGTWRVTVEAYFPGTRRWYTFDQASATSTARLLDS